MGGRMIHFSQKCSEINVKEFLLQVILYGYTCVYWKIHSLLVICFFSLHKIGVYWLIYVSIYNTVYLLRVYRMLLFLFPSTCFSAGTFSGKIVLQVGRKVVEIYVCLPLKMKCNAMWLNGMFFLWITLFVVLFNIFVADLV